MKQISSEEVFKVWISSLAEKKVYCLSCLIAAANINGVIPSLSLEFMSNPEDSKV